MRKNENIMKFREIPMAFHEIPMIIPIVIYMGNTQDFHEISIGFQWNFMKFHDILVFSHRKIMFSYEKKYFDWIVYAINIHNMNT